MLKPLVHNVVVAINGSESSVHAAMYGIIISKLHHYNLKFVYVVDTATLKRLTIGKFLLDEESDSFEKNLHADGQKYLDNVMALAKKKGVKAQCEILEGSVWGEVVKAADKFNAELILIGTDGGEFSITDKEILANAKCSVLVVREPKIEQLFRIS